MSEAIVEWEKSLPDNAKLEARTRIRSIARSLEQRRVRFLCGAGMSKASGLPLSTHLAKGMVKQLVDAGTVGAVAISNLATMYPIEAITDAYVGQFDAPSLSRFLHQQFDLGTSSPHAGHAAIEFLATQQYVDRVYTTNFDELIEQQFSGRAKSITDTNVDELQDALNHNFPVIHLHGSLGSGYTLGERNTYRLDTPLARILEADMVTNWFIWVGYSLSDVDLKTMFFSLRDLLAVKDLAKRPTVVHPLLLDTAEARTLEWSLADKVWRARGVTFIPGVAETFLPALVDFVGEVRSDRLVDALALQLSGKRPQDDGYDAEVNAIKAKAKKLVDRGTVPNLGAGIQTIAQAEGVR